MWRRDVLLWSGQTNVCAAPRGCITVSAYWRAQPPAKNGVKMAQRACFPEKVIRIIGEYNGEEALPSTIESAIVDMGGRAVEKTGGSG